MSITAGLRTAPHELYIEETGPDFVMKNLSNVFATQRFSDLKLVCKGGKVVSAHVAVLANISPFLKKIFRECSHPLNPQPLMVSLPDASATDVQILIKLAYSGKDILLLDANRKSSLLELIKYLKIRSDIRMQPVKRAANSVLTQPLAKVVREQEEEDESSATDEEGFQLLEPKTELLDDEIAEEEDNFEDMEEEERAAMQMLRDNESSSGSTTPMSVTPVFPLPIQLPQLPLPPSLNMSSWQPMPMPQALSTPSLTVRRITQGPGTYSTATKAELDAKTREILSPKRS